MVDRPAIARLSRQHMRQHKIGFGGVIEHAKELRVGAELAEAMTHLDQRRPPCAGE
jgi:hypothetical protein